LPRSQTLERRRQPLPLHRCPSRLAARLSCCLVNCTVRVGPRPAWPGNGEQRDVRETLTARCLRRKQSGSTGEGAGSRSENRSEGVTSDKGRTAVRVHTSSRIGTSVRSRGHAGIAVSGGTRDDVIIKGKRTRHVVAVHEPSERTVIKKKRIVSSEPRRRHIMYSEPERRTVLIKKRHPTVAISGEPRTTIRTRSANVLGGRSVRSGGVNVRSSRAQHSPSGGTVGLGGSASSGRAANGSGGPSRNGAGSQGSGVQGSGGGSGASGTK
jgi:hypothetical protein